MAGAFCHITHENLAKTVACYFLNLALATFAGFSPAGHFSTVIQLQDHLIVGAQGPQSFSLPLHLPLQRTWSTQGGFLTVGIPKQPQSPIAKTDPARAKALT